LGFVLLVAGDWVNNKAEGRGKYIYVNGNRYEGEQAGRGQRGACLTGATALTCGASVALHHSGRHDAHFHAVVFRAVCAGQWKGNMMDGHGKLWFATGDR
jgi:hypothetical protein